MRTLPTQGMLSKHPHLGISVLAIGRLLPVVPSPPAWWPRGTFWRGKVGDTLQSSAPLQGEAMLPSSTSEQVSHQPTVSGSRHVRQPGVLSCH